LNLEYDSDELGEESDDRSAPESVVDEETVEVKRVRMAKDILSKLQVDEDEENDGPLDAVSRTLHKNLLESEGRLQASMASRLHVEVKPLRYRGHRLSTTCVALSEAEDMCFTGSKDCSIVRWDVETGERMARYTGHPASNNIPASSIDGHFDEVLAIALSSDGRYLASAGRDRLINIWDARTDKFVDSFSGHQDTVSGLTFQHGKHVLYSCSHDRSVRAWNIDEMAYVESLFGHTSEINAIDCLHHERAVTCSMDRTVRYWKIPEESQLLMQGYHSGSIDCIKMVDETHFVSGSQDGRIALWHTAKKKPCSVVKNAHSGCWISSVAALKNTDLIASGASDGYVKFWQVNFNKRELVGEMAGCIEVPGVVNGLAFGSSGQVLVAANGQEHRLGRWGKHKDGKNGIVITRLNFDTDKESCTEISDSP